MANVGILEILVILIVVIVYGIILLIPSWMIVKKAGYNPALSLLILIPLVNLAALYVFAFSHWPEHRGE